MICVTSSNPAEGKSSVASNLATVAIAKYEKVLLIDCDLRKPVQHKIFKVSNKLGISNLMKEKSEIDLEIGGYFQKFKDNSTDGKLYVLTSGKSVPNPQEMLASDRFKELIEKFREMFDYIIIEYCRWNTVCGIRNGYSKAGGKKCVDDAAEKWCECIGVCVDEG